MLKPIQLNQFGLNIIFQKKQKQELLRLADKYKSRAYAEAKINQGKTVAYFDGFFEIYMPFPDIDVWKRILADSTA